MKKTGIKTIGWMVALLALPLPAMAAVQGSLGAISTGSVNISITKSVQAQISNLTDMVVANWSVGDGAVQLTSNACIYSSTGSYKVTASGSGPMAAFSIASGVNTIPYTVAWNAGGAGALLNTGTALNTNVQSTNFANANTTSATCGGGGAANDTARVIVNISSANMEAASSSNVAYTGTLTLMVAPF